MAPANGWVRRSFAGDSYFSTNSNAVAAIGDSHRTMLVARARDSPTLRQSAYRALASAMTSFGLSLYESNVAPRSKVRATPERTDGIAKRKSEPITANSMAYGSRMQGDADRAKVPQHAETYDVIESMSPRVCDCRRTPLRAPASRAGLRLGPSVLAQGRQSMRTLRSFRN